MRDTCGIISVAALAGLIATAADAFELSPNSPRARAAMDAARSASVPAAQAPADQAPSRIRVKYREALTTTFVASDIAASIARTTDARVQSRVADPPKSTEDIVLDRTVSEQELRRISESIARNPAVEWAVPETIDRPQQANDPHYAAQWHYHQPRVGIQLPGTWAQSTGKSVVVAVIDTGIREHADIKAQLLKGYDFVSRVTSSNDGDGRDADATDPGDWCPSDPIERQISSWHGLHVAGTVAAATNNSLGVAGVAPDVRILPVRVLGQCGGSNLDIADGIRWAAGVPVDGVENPTPAKVINLSLGGFGPCDAAYTQAIRQARQRGATVVVAAGNRDADSSNFRPANCEGVITVAATNNQGARAKFSAMPGSGSNFGANVKIAAPGGETHQTLDSGILSTLNDGVTVPGNDSYEAYQGTSMAAPHVAGVVALMYQVHPNILPDEVLSILQSTSQPFPVVTTRQCDTTICGAGIVNAQAAVAEAAKRGAMVSAATGGTPGRP